MMPKMMKCFTVLSLFLLITGANMLVFRDSRQLDSRQVDSAKAGLEFVGKLAEVSKKSFKSNDQMKALQSFLGAFKYLGPLANLGVSFANAMFSMGLDPDQAIMQQRFNNMNRGIEQLETKLGEIKNRIEELSTQNLAFSPIQTLKATSRTIDSNDVHPTNVTDHRITETWLSRKQQEALLSIYSLVDGDVLHNSLLKPHVENADVHKLLEISLYLTNLLARGFADYVFIAKVYFMEIGKMSQISSDEAAKKVCLKELHGKQEKFVFNINEAIKEAKDKADGVMKERVRAILNENHGRSKKNAADEIKKELVNNFAWKVAAISVYNPCSGFDCYTVGGSIHYGFREHGKNWFVIWQNKDSPKANVNRSDIKDQVSALASKGVRHEEDKEAKTVYHTLMQQLRPKPKSLAVVQHGNGLSYVCTDSHCTDSPFHFITQAFTFNITVPLYDDDVHESKFRNKRSNLYSRVVTLTKTFTIMIGF